jgi:hypothetical protein
MDSNRTESEGINRLKDRFMHPDADSFNIRRAPKREIAVFKEYANKEFLGDYGMAFRDMVQKMLIEPSENALVLDIAEDHEQRLQALENPNPEKKEETNVVWNEKKTISGRIIRWKSHEKKKGE